MYINSLKIKNFRIFKDNEVEFLHPDIVVEKKGVKTPEFNNVNLLVGDNGSGKTTLLKAIALSVLSPIIKNIGFVPYFLIRRHSSVRQKTVEDSTVIDYINEAVLEGSFFLHDEDVDERYIESEFSNGEYMRKAEAIITRDGDLEEIQPIDSLTKKSVWSQMKENKSPAFLMVGYGATRRVEIPANFDFGTRKRQGLRYQRVQGLFEDSYSLIPLTSWLPKLETTNPNHYREVIRIIDHLLPEPFSFFGYFESGEYLFRQEKIMIPFDALSDGYRSYIGWITDLLYHINMACPENKKLKDSKGIVMVDEIDLHLHPTWQKEVLQILSKTFPNLQFIFTTHSPILTGSLQPQNIIVMEMKGAQSELIKLKRNVYGLNTDQILVSEYFGLDSTRAPGIEKKMHELTLKAMDGDHDASLKFLEYMANGEEADLDRDDSL